ASPDPPDDHGRARQDRRCRGDGALSLRAAGALLHGAGDPRQWRGVSRRLAGSHHYCPASAQYFAAALSCASASRKKNSVMIAFDLILSLISSLKAKCTPSRPDVWWHCAQVTRLKSIACASCRLGSR